MLKKVLALLMTMKPHRHLVSLWPLIFAIVLSYNSQSSIKSIVLLLLAFILFYSGVYQINEVVDLERDKQDPVRAKRPLASGVITVKEVLTCTAILMFAGIGITAVLRPVILFCYMILFIINILYVFVLKKYPYIDLFIISTTQVVKFIIGILATMAMFSFAQYFDILVIVYLVILVFQIQKQIIRFQAGRISMKKGNFEINVQTLSVIRNISLILVFIILFRLTTAASVFLWIYSIGLTLFIVATSLKWKPIIVYLREYDKQ